MKDCLKINVQRAHFQLPPFSPNVSYTRLLKIEVCKRYGQMLSGVSINNNDDYKQNKAYIVFESLSMIVML